MRFSKLNDFTTVSIAFNPSSFGKEVIILAIPADRQTKSHNITYVKNIFR